MKHQAKRFNPDAIQHIYIRAVDRGVIYYSIEDRLVCLTTYAVYAHKYRIVVVAASIMFTHSHQSVKAENATDLDKYLQDSGSSFVQAYNHEHGRKGELYDKPPGRAAKPTSKSKRSNIVYVYNNHVEKGLCHSAMDERWSLLAYGHSPNPFSEKYDPSRSSDRLKRYMKLVDRHVSNLQPLKYSTLHMIFRDLDGIEREQFVDYVIVKYAWIEYSAAASQFGSFEQLVRSADATTGSEWDIREEYSRESDIPYNELIE